MYNLHEEQKKEIATIKERTISLNLSDADCKRLARKCGEVGLTISALLENFIGDLVYGTYSNGSDENMFANQWFERCGFSMPGEKTLLKHLLNYSYDIEEFIDVCDEINHYKEHPEEYEDEIKEDGYENLWFNVEYKDFTEDFINDNPNIDMEKEIDICRKWLEDFKKFKGNC